MDPNRVKAIKLALEEIDRNRGQYATNPDQNRMLATLIQQHELKDGAKLNESGEAVELPVKKYRDLMNHVGFEDDRLGEGTKIWQLFQKGSTIVKQDYLNKIGFHKSGDDAAGSVPSNTTAKASNHGANMPPVGLFGLPTAQGIGQTGAQPKIKLKIPPRSLPTVLSENSYVQHSFPEVPGSFGGDLYSMNEVRQSQTRRIDPNSVTGQALQKSGNDSMANINPGLSSGTKRGFGEIAADPTTVLQAEKKVKLSHEADSDWLSGVQMQQPLRTITTAAVGGTEVPLATGNDFAAGQKRGADGPVDDRTSKAPKLSSDVDLSAPSMHDAQSTLSETISVPKDNEHVKSLVSASTGGEKRKATDPIEPEVGPKKSKLEAGLTQDAGSEEPDKSGQIVQPQPPVQCDGSSQPQIAESPQPGLNGEKAIHTQPEQRDVPKQLAQSDQQGDKTTDQSRPEQLDLSQQPTQPEKQDNATVEQRQSEQRSIPQQPTQHKQAAPSRPNNEPRPTAWPINPIVPLLVDPANGQELWDLLASFKDRAEEFAYAILDDMGVDFNQSADFVANPSAELRVLYERIFGKDWKEQALLISHAEFTVVDILKALVCAAMYKVAFEEELPWMGPDEAAELLVDFQPLLDYALAEYTSTNRQVVPKFRNLLWKASKYQFENPRFLREKIEPHAADLAKSFMLTVKPQLQAIGATKITSGQPSTEFWRHKIEVMTKAFSSATLIRGKMRASRYHYEIHWPTSGELLDRVSMKETGNTQRPNRVRFCFHPAIWLRESKDAEREIFVQALVASHKKKHLPEDLVAASAEGGGVVTNTK